MGIFDWLNKKPNPKVKPKRKQYKRPYVKVSESTTMAHIHEVWYLDNTLDEWDHFIGPGLLGQGRVYYLRYAGTKQRVTSFYRSPSHFSNHFGKYLQLLNVDRKRKFQVCQLVNSKPRYV